MAHRKLRDNTSVIVYKYGAQPLDVLPDAFWQTAKETKNIWNDLVGMRNKLTDNFSRLGISGKDKVKERIKYWEQFDKIWHEHLKSDDIKSRLGSDEREHLEQKFDTADKRAKKEKTGLKKQFGLDKIYYRHRYSSRGKPLNKFQSQNSLGFTFLFPTAKHYESNTKQSRYRRIGSGSFGVVKDREQIFSFPFSAVIHREIPPDAIIKSVSWVGKRLRSGGLNKKHLPESQRDWSWSIDVACEIPIKQFESKEKVKMVALDVGWRSNGDYLRLGAMIDNGGNKLELRLPVNYQTNSARYGKLVSGISALIELDERIGNLIQSTKDELAKLGIKHLLKMRENGLFRLERELAESGENEEALKLLESFKAEYLKLRSCRGRSFDRMNKYRDWLYQNTAAWLAENYDVLIWEGKLNLKKMAEDRKDLNKVPTEAEKELEKIRRRAAKHRNYASLYSFRECLKKAFAKRGKTIIDGVTAYSSRTCSDCGTIVEKFANVEFVCPNGHNFDRDFNAAKNLLNQFINHYDLTAIPNLIIPSKPHRNLSKIVVALQ